MGSHRQEQEIFLHQEQLIHSMPLDTEMQQNIKHPGENEWQETWPEQQIIQWATFSEVALATFSS